MYTSFLIHIHVHTLDVVPLPYRVNSELDRLANVSVAFQVHCLSCVNPLVATEMFACSPSQLVVTKIPVWVQFHYVVHSDPSAKSGVHMCTCMQEHTGV